MKSSKSLLLVSIFLASGTLLLQKTPDDTIAGYSHLLIFSCILWAASLILLGLAIKSIIRYKFILRTSLAVATGLFLTATILMQTSYKEVSIVMLPGEAIRLPIAKSKSVISSIFNNKKNESQSLAELRSKKFTLKKKETLDSDTRNKLIDVQVQLNHAFEVIENDRLENRNIPLVKRQELFYDNTTLILDYLLKRYTLVRNNKKFSIASWQRTFDFNAYFLAGRLPVKRIAPNVAKLFKFDLVEFRFAGTSNAIEQWSVSVQLSGEKQLRLTTESVLEVGNIKLKPVKYQHLILTENSKELPLGITFKEDNYQGKPIKSIVAPTAQTAIHGAIKAGFYNEHNSWVNIKHTQISLLDSEKIKVVESKNLKIITTVEFLLFQKRFQVMLLLAIVLMLVTLLFEMMMKLNEGIEPLD